jgi:hypothetical protein
MSKQPSRSHPKGNAMYAMFLGSTPAEVRSNEDREAIRRSDLDAAVDAHRGAVLRDLEAGLIARIRGAVGRSEAVDPCPCPA